MTQPMPGFTASRKIGKRLVTVQLLANNKPHLYHEPYDITKIKKPKKIKGNYLPADFLVTGLPCEITFRLDKVKTYAESYSMQITQISFDCPNGLQSSDTPIDLLRRLAVEASAFVAEITPANTRTQIAPNAYSVTDSKGGFEVLGHSGADKERTEAFIGSRPTGKDLYKQIGDLYSTLPITAQNTKKLPRRLVALHAWAYKHTAIGAKKYPQFFKGYKKQTTKKKGKKTK
jgi:hypothetical protein